MPMDKTSLIVALLSIRDDVQRLSTYIDAKVLMQDLGVLGYEDDVRATINTLEDLAGALDRAEERLAEDIEHVKELP